MDEFIVLVSIICVLLIVFFFGMYIGESKTDKSPTIEIDEYCQSFYGMDGAIVGGQYYCGKVKEGHVEKIHVLQSDFETWRQIRDDK